MSARALSAVRQTITAILADDDVGFNVQYGAIKAELLGLNVGIPDCSIDFAGGTNFINGVLPDNAIIESSDLTFPLMMIDVVTFKQSQQMRPAPTVMAMCQARIVVDLKWPLEAQRIDFGSWGDAVLDAIAAALAQPRWGDGSVLPSYDMEGIKSEIIEMDMEPGGKTWWQRVDLLANALAIARP